MGEACVAVLTSDAVWRMSQGSVKFSFGGQSGIQGEQGEKVVPEGFAGFPALGHWA